MKESEEDIIAAHDEKGGESLVSVILSKYRIVDGKEEMVAKYGLPGKEIEILMWRLFVMDQCQT